MITDLSTEPAQDTVAKLASHERKCLVTGAVRAKESLIRFALSPDNHVVPDLAQNLPGRGFWVSADHASLLAAAQKNPFSRAAKQTVRVDADLADSVYRLHRRRIMDMLGLAKRAGLATLGLPQVESTMKAGKLACLLAAADAGRDMEKLPAEQRGITVIRDFSREELGMALGYDQIVYLGLSPDKLTKKIVAMCGQLAALSPLPVTAQPDSQQQ